MKQWLKKIVLLSLLITSSLRADDSLDEVFDGFEENLGEISLDELQKFQNDNAINGMSLKMPLTAGQLAFGLVKIQEPLWKNTRAPAGRDILYLLPYKLTAVEYGGISVKLFYNMTPQMPVTAGDLLNISPNLIENFGLIPGSISPQEAHQLMPLFLNMTLQERKAGFLIQSGFIKGPFTIQLHTSIGLGERNFWLNNRDADQIKAVFEAKFGSSEFNEKEFYIIRYGMGDTRLKVGLNTINMTSFQNDLGFEVIIPTSAIGYTPKINIGIAQTEFEGEKLQASAVNTLRGVRDYLINPRLGIGHFALGCYMESKVNIFHDMAQLWTRLSYDVLFPGIEDRLFLFKQTISLGELGKIPITGNTPEEQAIVSQFVRENIFPSSLKSNVTPGGILNFVFAANIDLNKNWRWAFGYDFYAQQDELISKIYNTNTPIQALRVKDAESASVLQHKIFTEVMWHKKTKHKDFGVGLGGDVTISSKRIGEDWTVYFKVATSF